MKPYPEITNALSIDVEGFIESNLQSFPIPSKYINPERESYEIEKNIDATLNLLGTLKIKATFFFVGRIAKTLPKVILEVGKEGHEIGCHNYEHLRLFNLKPEEFRVNLMKAKRCLEDVSGQKVFGFRAPEFSISKSTLWTLDVLQEIGFIYDSSIYPIGLHDVYGIKDAPPHIHRLPNGLIEFPLPTIQYFGKRFPFGGGGYFRLFPLFVTKYFLSKVNRAGHPCVFYMHPYEIGPMIPKVSELSTYRKFRHYFHCQNGHKRLDKLLRSFEFGPVIDVLNQQGFIRIL